MSDFKERIAQCQEVLDARNSTRNEKLGVYSTMVGLLQEQREELEFEFNQQTHAWLNEKLYWRDRLNVLQRELDQQHCLRQLLHLYPDFNPEAFLDAAQAVSRAGLRNAATVLKVPPFVQESRKAQELDGLSFTAKLMELQARLEVVEGHFV